MREFEIVEYDWDECAHLINDANRQVIASGLFLTPVVDSKTGERIFKVFIEKAVRARMTEAQYNAALLHEEAHYVFDRERLLSAPQGAIFDIEMEARADRYAIEKGADPQDLFEANLIVLAHYYKRVGLTCEEAKLEGSDMIKKMLTYPYYKEVKV